MSVNVDAYRTTAKPIVAGIFNIIVGAGYLVGVLGLLTFGLSFVPFGIHFPEVAGAALFTLSIPMTVAGIIALIGGIFCLQRNAWGWALAGSIATIFISHVFGIIAVILVALSRNEFHS